jgi:hypothetical protein
MRSVSASSSSDGLGIWRWVERGCRITLQASLSETLSCLHTIRTPLRLLGGLKSFPCLLPYAYENIASARIKKLLLKPYPFRANDKDVQMGLAHVEVSCEFKKYRFKGATILVYEDGTKKEIKIKYLWKDITSDDIEGYRKYLCEKVR